MINFINLLHIEIRSLQAHLGTKYILVKWVKFYHSINVIKDSRFQSDNNKLKFIRLFTWQTGSSIRLKQVIRRTVTLMTSVRIFAKMWAASVPMLAFVNVFTRQGIKPGDSETWNQSFSFGDIFCHRFFSFSFFKNEITSIHTFLSIWHQRENQVNLNEIASGCVSIWLASFSFTLFERRVVMIAEIPVRQEQVKLPRALRQECWHPPLLTRHSLTSLQLLWSASFFVKPMWQSHRWPPSTLMHNCD